MLKRFLRIIATSLLWLAAVDCASWLAGRGLSIRACLAIRPIGGVLAFQQAPIASASPVASDPLSKLREEYERMEIDGKVNYTRYVAFTILKQYLPAGTRFTSGYRSPEKQLEVIRSLASKYNAAKPADRIPEPPGQMRVNDPGTWRPTLDALRERGYFITAPNHTLHATDEVVFDMSGPNLEAIKQACERAQRDEWMTFAAITVEPVNNAVHVHVKNFSAKSSATLQGGTVQPTEATGPNKQLPLIQELASQHNSTGDLDKQIDYDKERIRLWGAMPRNSVTDAQTIDQEIQRLQQEIENHKREKVERAQKKDKEAAFDSANRAREEGRLEEAERQAEEIVNRFSDDNSAKALLTGIKARRLVNRAVEWLIEGDCDDCEKAAQAIDEALKQDSGNQNAQSIQREIKNWGKSCSSGFIMRIVLGVVLAGVLLAGLFFWLRPGSWALEVIEGPNFGDVFPLEQPETVVGASEDEADFVVSDDHSHISRRHCVIKQQGRRFHLTDESSNGTTVNGQWVEEDGHWLRKGDKISLADAAELLFRRQ